MFVNDPRGIAMEQGDSEALPLVQVARSALLLLNDPLGALVTHIYTRPS